MTEKLKAALQIIRPANFLISFFSIAVACLICLDREETLKPVVIIAALSGALIGAAGNVINDYLDIEIDRINRPERVLPSERMSQKGAVVLYIFLNITAYYLGSLLNFPAFLIVVISSVILFLYSFLFKKITLLGNAVVAIMTALAFIFGGVAVNNWRSAAMPAVFALLINFIREIVKDIEDIEGDRLNNVITFPAKYGIKVTVELIITATLLLFFLTLLPFVLNYYKIEYFIVVMLTVNLLFVYFLKSLLKDQSRKNLGRLSSVLKVNMILGLLAIYLGR